MEKKRNLWIIPTNKPSRLYYSISMNNQGLILSKSLKIRSSTLRTQNIYITSNEEIKEWDWIYYKHFGEDIICKYDTKGGLNTNVNEHKDFYKKIILTTDQELIKDGVQEIDEDFLQWFVNNSNCEEVEIGEGIRCEDEWIDNEDGGEIFQHQYCCYKIIIPSEKPKQVWEQIIEDCGGEEEFMKSAGLLPKQKTLNLDNLESKLDNALEKETEESLTSWLQEKRSKMENKETIEEASIRIYPDNIIQLGNETSYNAALIKRKDFIDGAKLQQERMYSEEDMHKAYCAGSDFDMSCLKDEQYYMFREWFNQFKNK